MILVTTNLPEINVMTISPLVGQMFAQQFTIELAGYDSSKEMTFLLKGFVNEGDPDDKALKLMPKAEPLEVGSTQKKIKLP